MICKLGPSLEEPPEEVRECERTWPLGLWAFAGIAGGGCGGRGTVLRYGCGASIGPAGTRIVAPTAPNPSRVTMSAPLPASLSADCHSALRQVCLPDTAATTIRGTAPRWVPMRALQRWHRPPYSGSASSGSREAVVQKKLTHVAEPRISWLPIEAPIKSSASLTPFAPRDF